MGMGRGAAGAMGAVLHGEFTTNLTGTPTVMVVQTGQVTAYTAGQVAHREEHRRLRGHLRPRRHHHAHAGRNATALATGVQVHVVAAKEGMKVTALVVG